MAERFESMQEAAMVDNYLANTSHSPKPSKACRLDAVHRSPTHDQANTKQVRRHMRCTRIVAVAVVLMIAASVHAADTKTSAFRPRRPRKGS